MVIINPWFLTPLFGTAAACAFLIIASLLQWHDPGAWYWLVGGVLYLVGTILVTMIFNVPRNDALAVVAPLESGSREALDRVPLHVDRLESRPHGRRARGRGVVHHRIPFSSVGIIVRNS